MAGHSQFKNIMHRKGAQDAKRNKMFSKLIREMTTAARTGLPDPAANPRLRAAIIAAREANMPKDTIDRAIKRATGADGAANYEEVRYEGYGPGGVAVIVEALTDNRNRTAGEIRAAFTKHGGNLGETNSVSFMFERTGHIHYAPAAGDAEKIFELALDAGAADVESGGDGHEVYCAPDDFNAVRDGLEKALGAASSAKLIWKPVTTAAVAGDIAQSLIKLIEVLDDNDDVQTVTANFEIADAELARLTAA